MGKWVLYQGKPYLNSCWAVTMDMSFAHLWNCEYRMVNKITLLNSACIVPSHTNVKKQLVVKETYAVNMSHIIQWGFLLILRIDYSLIFMRSQKCMGDFLTIF